MLTSHDYSVFTDLSEKNNHKGALTITWSTGSGVGHLKVA